MKRIISTIGAGIVAAIIGLTSIVSSYAAPVTPVQVQVTSNIEKAQYREKRWHRAKEHRHDRYKKHDRRHSRYDRRDRSHRWNGHRGYREKRAGYRRGHDGWWYPRAAFIIRR
jgi:hypothetical protein